MIYFIVKMLSKLFFKQIDGFCNQNDLFYSKKMYDFDGLNEVIGTKELLAQGKKYE